VTVSIDAQSLYSLLPAIVRIRDIEQGGRLEALIAVLADQAAVLDEDLSQLYDDQFIETCADWVAPYIGDLIGYRHLHAVSPRIASVRAEIAHTIGYRRRKGTAAMLEQLAQDVTGWSACVVEVLQAPGHDPVPEPRPPGQQMLGRHAGLGTLGALRHRLRQPGSHRRRAAHRQRPG